MKTLPWIRLVPAAPALFLIGAFFFSATTLSAQEPKPASTPVSSRPTPVHFEVNDAPLSEVADKMRDLFADVNVVVSRDVENVRITLKLRSANLEQFSRAIEFASNEAVVVREIAEKTIGFSRNWEHQGETKATCRIFALKKYLADKVANKDEQQTNEAITTLQKQLHEAFAMLSQVTPEEHLQMPQLSFNPQTELLIAIGKPSELDLVDQMVRALEGAPPLRTPEAGPARSTPPKSSKSQRTSSEVELDLPPARRR